MRISVDGNIGCGKTTVLAALATAFPGVSVMPEPVRDWHDLLELYYTDPKTWALPLNLKILLSFRAAAAHGIVERSPLSCHTVFSKIARDDDNMDAKQFDIFKDYYEVLGWQPDAIVYIDTPLAECAARIERRRRTGEADIDLQYLRRVEFAYAAMLRDCGVPVERVDGSQSPEDVAAAVIAAVKKLNLA